MTSYTEAIFYINAISNIVDYIVSIFVLNIIVS